MRVTQQIIDTLAHLYQHKKDQAEMYRLKEFEIMSQKKFSKLILNDDGLPALVK